MGKSLYGEIYCSLRSEITSEAIPVGSFLPSELSLIKKFNCSRMTVRKAISLLANEGLVQSIKGRGVKVISTPQNGLDKESAFTVCGLSSFTESARVIGADSHSKVIFLEHVTADEELSALTGMTVEADLTHLGLLRTLDSKPVAIDRHYFLTEAVPGINEDNAIKSLFRYIEDDLGKTISVSQRSITIEKPTKEDCELLKIPENDYLAVMRSRTFDSLGLQFEYVESKYIPSIFHFHDTATRTPLP